MNKSTILSRVLEALESELKRQKQANELAASGATDSESKAESKWDTGGLEASYLARGYAQQYEALSNQLNQLRGFSPPSFAGQPIGVGALVEVDMDGYTTRFFLLPCSGGMEVRVDETEVTVITPESPVAAALMGKRSGHSFSFRADAPGTITDVE